MLTAGSIYRNKDHNQRETKEARVSLDSNDQSKEEAGSDLGAGNEDSQAKELEVKSLAVDKVDDQPGKQGIGKNYCVYRRPDSFRLSFCI